MQRKHDNLTRRIGRRLAAAVAGLLLAFGGPAVAEEGDEVTVISEYLFSGGQIASAVVTQVIRDNVIVEHNVVRRNVILDSFNNGSGAMLLNADAGNNSNQANVLVIAVGRSPDGVLQDLSVTASAEITGNSITVTGGARTNLIENSFNGARGVALVNQNVGNANINRNILVIGFGVTASPDFILLKDMALSDLKAGNTVDVDPAAPRTSLKKNSFNDFKGIALVTRTAGDANIASNTATISARVVTLP